MPTQICMGKGADVRFLLPTSLERGQERRFSFAPDSPFYQIRRLPTIPVAPAPADVPSPDRPRTR